MPIENGDHRFMDNGKGHAETMESEYNPYTKRDDVILSTSQDEQTDEPHISLKEKKTILTRITVAAAAAIVILFAYVWETAYQKPQEESKENLPQREISVVQKELNKLDWVVPALLPINEYSRPGTLITEVNGIVIHNIGNPNTTAQQNRNYFANLAVTGERHASSNFIICLDGRILQCVPVDEIAHASNDRNADTLSIELCHPDDTGKFTEETYASAIRLTAWLCKQYKLTSADILRHFDVYEKECPRYFVTNEDAWETFKSDVAAAMESEQ